MSDATARFSGSRYVADQVDAALFLAEIDGGSLSQRDADTRAAVLQPTGGETIVNGTTVGTQSGSRVAYLTNGRYVIIWESDHNVNGTTSNDLFGRIFNADGTAFTADFTIPAAPNSTTNSGQVRGDVTALAGGGFVVTWFDTHANTGGDIIARVFDAAGVGAATNIQVNDLTQTHNNFGTQTTPVTVGLTGGQFAIAWTDLNGSDGAGAGIRTRVFNADGTAASAETLVNTTTTLAQQNPAISKLGTGYVVVWQDGSNASGQGVDIRAQRYDLNGAKVGGEILITSTASTQEFPAVTELANGSFAVAWTDFSATGGDTSGSAIKARIVSAAGVLQGSEFLINSTTNGAQSDVALARVGTGFAATWTDAGLNAGDTSGNAVRSRMFDAAGAATGAEQLVNTATFGNEDQAAIASDASGNYVIVFRGHDNDGSNIHFQRFAATEPTANDDTLAAVEDTAITYAAADLLGNDTDPEGNPLSIASVTAVSGGTVVLNGDGTVTFTPGANFNGAAQFDYVARDAAGSTDSARATVIVAAVNDAPTTANLQGDAVSYTEQQGQKFLDLGANATIADPDSGNFNGGSLRVQITDGLQAGVDAIFFVGNGVVRLSSQSIGATVFVKLSSDPVELAIGTLANDNLFQNNTVINFNTDDATPARVQQLLRSITYNGNSDTLNSGQRTITYTLNDGDGGSSTTTSFVNVTAVNDVPTTTSGTGSASFVESAIGASTPVAVAPSFSVSDLDNATLASATVSISANFEATDLLAFANTNSTTFGNIAASYDAGTGALTLTSAGATATLTQFRSAVRAVTFTSTSDAPSTATRTISFVVNDGAANSVATTRNVTITATNDAPVLAGGGNTVAYAENTAGTVVNSALTVSDVDSTTLSGATVSISAGRVVGDTLTFADQNGITGSYSATTGVLTLAGSASLANYQTALRSISFTSTSDDPTGAARTVSFVINDGAGANNLSAAATTTVNVTASNDRPTLTGFGPSVTFTESVVNGAPQLLDIAVTVTDAEGNFAGQTLTLSGALAEDMIAIRDQGTVAGQIGVSGGNVTFGGTLIGTVSGGSGTTALSVLLNANATTAAVEALIENLTYANASDTPTASRTLTLTITDGGGFSGIGTFTSLTGTVNPFNGIDVGSLSAPAFIDLDGDGDLDLVVGEQNSLLVYRNNGVDQAYTQLTGTANPFNGIAFGADVSPAFVDLDGDGDLDGVFGNFEGQLVAARNNGAGAAFTLISGAANPFNGINFGTNASAAFIDFDGDGDLDTVTSSTSSALLAFRNNGNGLAVTQLTGAANPFSGLTVGGNGKIAAIDFDFDGDLDLVLAAGNAGPLQAFRNNGAGQSFTALTGSASPFNGISGPANGTVAFNDFDRDGDTDVVLGMNNGALSVIRNNSTNTGRPITVTVTAVNDLPVNSVPGATQNGIEDVNFVFSTANGNALSVADVDTTTLAVTLGVVSGVLTLSGTAGLSFATGDGTADATMTFTGTAAAINAALEGLIYRGTLNFNGNDTLTLTSSDGIASDTDTVTIALVSDGEIDGDAAANVLTGTPQSDLFDLRQGGDDSVSGLASDDLFYFGAAYTSGDSVDGGAGMADRILLQGDYSGGITLGSLTGVESVGLMAGNDASFGGQTGTNLSYVISATDASVTASGSLELDASTLRAGETFTFDGAAELDGAFRVTGGLGNDNLTTGSGNDTLDGGGGDDSMAGGSGDDIYIVNSDFDVVTEATGAGIDEIRTSIRKASAAANIENLTYIGGGNFSGRGNGLGNVLTGGDGDDALFGKGGDDRLNGGEGHDTLDGGSGADTIEGGDGDDVIYAVDGLDTIDGGAGTDTVIFYIPDAIVTGTSSNVELFENASGGNLSAELNAGDNIFGGSIGIDTINGASGNDLLYGRAGNDVIVGGDGSDRLFGMEDDDSLSGGNDQDYLYGDTGNDVLSGNAGDDVLYGEDGTDILTGGTGIDYISGGAGADRFVFAAGDSGTTLANADRIADFSSAQGDKIDLSQISGLSFIGSAAFSNVAGELRSEEIFGNSYVMGDIDGDGIADFIIRLDGSVPLTASDFLL